MTFARLTRGDWVAAIAALALLLVMSLDWYTTEAGAEARRIEQTTEPSGALGGEVERKVKEDARIIAEKNEKTAWQARPFADRLILWVMLAAIGSAVAAAWLRAARVRFRPPLTPSGAAAGLGLAGVLLLAARIFQKPAAEAGAVVEAGAPLGLICLGALALGARAGWRAEREGRADQEPGERPDDEPDSGTEVPGAGERPRPPRLFDLEGDPDSAPGTDAPTIRRR